MHRVRSVPAVRKNFRRAGVLKKRFRTPTLVPTAPDAGLGSTTASPSIESSHAPASPACRERITKRETDAIDANASPRNPNDAIRSRSSAAAILLVACGATARGRSSRPIPTPSSVTRTSSTPPASSSTRTRVAPASRAFSSSSLTTLAGRSTTSPAAI